jgi:hypothetical protein
MFGYDLWRFIIIERNYFLYKSKEKLKFLVTEWYFLFNSQLLIPKAEGSEF